MSCANYVCSQIDDECRTWLIESLPDTLYASSVTCTFMMAITCLSTCTRSTSRAMYAGGKALPPSSSISKTTPVWCATHCNLLVLCTVCVWFVSTFIRCIFCVLFCVLTVSVHTQVAHFQMEHYACQDVKCRARGQELTSVFATAFELKAHEIAVHMDQRNLSRRERELVRVLAL